MSMRKYQSFDDRKPEPQHSVVFVSMKTAGVSEPFIRDVRQIVWPDRRQINEMQ